MKCVEGEYARHTGQQKPEFVTKIIFDFEINEDKNEKGKKCADEVLGYQRPIIKCRKNNYTEKFDSASDYQPAYPTLSVF